MRRRSLLFPLVGVLILTVLSTMGVGYFINYPFLYQSLHHTAQIENEARANHIGFLLEHETSALIQLAHVISRDGELQEAFTRHEQDFNRLMRKVMFLSETIHGVDFFGVVDTKGETLFATDDAVSEAGFPREALEKALKEGGALVATAIRGEWAVLALTPVLVQRRPIGVLVLGGWINKAMAQRLTQQNTLGLAFSAPDKSLTSTFDPKAWPPIDPRTVQSCIDGTRPITRLEESTRRGLHYSPIRIVDNRFCLILPLSLEAIHQTLHDHAIRLAWSSLIIIFMIILLGLTLHFLILQPLNRLRNKALILVEVCSNEKPQLPEMVKARHGNEIQVLDQAFETASTAIYSYIGDLSHQKEQFEDMAIRDPLTGLGNRRLFNQLVEKSIAYCHRYKRSMAVMYLDLDHFKPVNDTLGHDVGDLLLKEVSGRLKQTLRDTDVVFRLGGDEFAALLPECAGGEFARALGERLIQEVARPYALKSHTCSIGVSIGVSLYPDHSDSMESLLKHADLALYAAKDAGRGVCRTYDEIPRGGEG